MDKFLHEFLEYSDGSIKDNGWWKISGNKLINYRGGFHSYTPTDKDIIVEAEEFSELDWSCLIDNSNNTGWLDLNGIFYGCDPYDHNLLAEYYFKSTERDLEKIGFVKLYLNYDRKLTWYCEKDRPTKRQEDYLFEKGLSQSQDLI